MTARRLVVELAGPAGAGKTTLARALTTRDERARLGVPVTRAQLGRALAAALPSLVAARLAAPGRWWTAAELRSCGYLGAWPASVARATGEVVLFDHGPAFRLARLAVHGPPATRTPAWQRLRARLVREWAELLDVVVWLDAPDEELLRRVRQRDRVHPLRDLEPAAAASFLDRYRQAYDEVLALLAAGGVRVLRFDTSAGAPGDLVAAVRAELSAEALR